MKKKYVFTLGVLSLSAVGIAQSMVVCVTDITAAEGNVIVSVYNNAEDFTKVGKELKTVTVPAKKDSVCVHFEGLAEGEYAVAVLHDKNANGECDKNFLGIPKERFGFSNNIIPKIKAPSFQEVKTRFRDGGILNIKLIGL